MCNARAWARPASRKAHRTAQARVWGSQRAQAAPSTRRRARRRRSLHPASVAKGATGAAKTIPRRAPADAGGRGGQGDRAARHRGLAAGRRPGRPTGARRAGGRRSARSTPGRRRRGRRRARGPPGCGRSPPGGRRSPRWPGRRPARSLPTPGERGSGRGRRGRRVRCWTRPAARRANVSPYGRGGSRQTRRKAQAPWPGVSSGRGQGGQTGG